MSKLKKFFFHPAQFFRDARKKRLLRIFERPGRDANLFVVSHLNQLAQVQSLIRFERLENNYLLVLSTPADKVMPQMVRDAIVPELFTEVVQLELPRSPNNIHVGKLSRIHDLYAKAIGQLRPAQVFLLSFERHYALLGRLAVRHGARLFLVEEGTATYKIAADGRNMAGIDRGATGGPAALMLKAAPWLADLRPALGRVERFTGVHAAFPHLLKGAFQFDESHRFFLHAGGLTGDGRVEALIERYGITGADSIFVSQRYPVDYEVHADVIVSILTTIAQATGGRVFLKLHPKDRPELRAAYETLIRKRPRPLVVLIEEADFLIEPVIAHVKPRAIYGLTSTTLVYAPLVSPETRCYAVAPWFIADVRRHARYLAGKSDLSLVEDHFAILAAFPHVRAVEGPEHFAQELTRTDDAAARTDARVDAFLRLTAQRRLDEAAQAADALADDGLEAPYRPLVLAMRFRAEESAAYAQRVREACQDDAAQRLALGLGAWCRGDYARACELLAPDGDTTGETARETALGGGPLAAPFHASALRHAGRLQEAAACWATGAPAMRDTPFAEYELAQVAYAQGKPEKFLWHLGLALPEGVSAYSDTVLEQAAVAALQAGRTDVAAAVWEAYVRRLAQAGSSWRLLPGPDFERLCAAALDGIQTAGGIWRRLLDGAAHAGVLAAAGIVVPEPLTRARLDYFLVTEQWDEARAAVRQAIAAGSPSPALRDVVALLAAHSADPGLLDAWPQPPAPAAESAREAMQAWRLAANRDWDAVAAWCRRHAGLAAQRPEDRLALLGAWACRERADDDGARQWLIGYERAGGRDVYSTLELAALAHRGGQWEDVRTLLESVYGDAQAMPDRRFFAYLDALMALHEDERIEALFAADRSRFLNVPHLFAGLCRQRISAGRLQEVVDECDRYDVLPAEVAWQYARALRLLGRIEQAAEVLRQHAQQPASREEWALQAELDMLVGNVERAVEGYAHLVRHFAGADDGGVAYDRWCTARLLRALQATDAKEPLPGVARGGLP